LFDIALFGTATAAILLSPQGSEETAPLLVSFVEKEKKGRARESTLWQPLPLSGGVHSKDWRGREEVLSRAGASVPRKGLLCSL